MNFLTTAEILHMVTWFIALVELVLALYILVLNVWHSSNRHVSALLLFFAVNSFGLGGLLKAGDVYQATLPTILMALTSRPIMVGLLIVAVVLLKPEWFAGRRRWVGWVSYGLLFLPVVLGLSDVFLGTNLWYTGLDPAIYRGGYVSSREFVAGVFVPMLRPVYVYILSLLPFIPILIVALRRDTPRDTRRLAIVLFGGQLSATLFQFGLRPLFVRSFGWDELVSAAATAMVTSTVFAFSYAYVGFRQMLSERRSQRGQLRSRLTSLVLVVTLPTLLVIIAFLISRSSTLLEREGLEKLRAMNASLSANVNLWTDTNVQTLQGLVNQSGIVSMDAATQKPILEAMEILDPQIYLVSTTDLMGINVARSDGAALKDYSDRAWFTVVRDGAPVGFQTVVGKTSGEPALVVSMPIFGDSGDLVGVGMLATDLDYLSEEILAGRIGETGVNYVVDAHNRIVAHPDPAFTVNLYDASEFPGVVALRDQTQGTLTFIDDAGERWEMAFTELESEWGVVSQQAWRELRSPLVHLGFASAISMLAGSVLLLTLTYSAMRQAFAPIDSLNATVAAIIDGDLDREAPVESGDELGVLAQGFNQMTTQLRESISTLEQRVSERTFDLEQRSASLEASAEVSRAAASILDSDELIERVVGLIRERFGLYYVGLFLVDEGREWAVLRSGTGEAGGAMLARNHRIRIGEGMIGWSVANAQARIALIAEEDAVRLTNPELPDTRSEAALPLRSRGQVLGALTVQSAQPDAFDADILTVLQTLADQVAVAIDNARLYTSAQSALEAERRAYGVRTREAWTALMQNREDWGYIATRSPSNERPVVLEPVGAWHPEMVQAQARGQRVLAEDDSVIAVPIRARGEVIGVLRFDRGDDALPWSDEEIALVESLTDQLGQTLERAQLYEDTQQRAADEQMLNQITANLAQSLEMDDILQTVVRELGTLLPVEEVSVSVGGQSVATPALREGA